MRGNCARGRHNSEKLTQAKPPLQLLRPACLNEGEQACIVAMQKSALSHTIVHDLLKCGCGRAGCASLVHLLGSANHSAHGWKGTAVAPCKEATSDKQQVPAQQNTHNGQAQGTCPTQGAHHTCDDCLVCQWVKIRPQRGLLLQLFCDESIQPIADACIKTMLFL